MKITAKVLIVNLQRCTGCRVCVMACSFVKEKTFSPSKSRIRILSDEDKMLNIPILCWHCENPLCATACPVNAIYRDSKTGVVYISDKCTGCGLCLEKCPTNAIVIDSAKKSAIKCDLCGGSPECVKVCSAGALEYRECDPTSFLSKLNYTEKVIESLGVRM